MRYKKSLKNFFIRIVVNEEIKKFLRLVRWNFFYDKIGNFSPHFGKLITCVKMRTLQRILRKGVEIQMPSYAQNVKNELSRFFDETPECLSVELAALLNIGAIDCEGRKDFSNSNAAVARKVITLTKKLFPDARTEVAAVRTKKLRKTMKYFVRIFFEQNEEIFSNLTLHRREEKISYLRGAFLASGTVNRPESQYRLEIVSTTKDEANFLKKILLRLYFNPKVYQRGENFVVYLREGDAVCDFLGMTGAEEAVERFEIARNLKEVRLQVNRLMNCDAAGVNRAIEAAQRQLADIRLLKMHRTKVNERLAEAMQIRLSNPSGTTGELAEKIFITREGLRWRFKKIHELAENLRAMKNQTGE